jgi:hypothetical protein
MFSTDSRKAVVSVQPDPVHTHIWQILVDQNADTMMLSLVIHGIFNLWCNETERVNVRDIPYWNMFFAVLYPLFQSSWDWMWHWVAINSFLVFCHIPLCRLAVFCHIPLCRLAIFCRIRLCRLAVLDVMKTRKIVPEMKDVEWETDTHMWSPTFSYSGI